MFGKKYKKQHYLTWGYIPSTNAFVMEEGKRMEKINGEKISFYAYPVTIYVNKEDNAVSIRQKIESTIFSNLVDRNRYGWVYSITDIVLNQVSRL